MGAPESGKPCRGDPFCDVAGRARKHVVPGITIRSFWGQQSLLAIVNLEAGVVLPPHHHPAEQTGTVLSGELELTIGGEARHLLPGDAYIIPGGVEHSARTGASPAILSEVFCPIREDYQY
jgi:quercetin dioxygenase-like cupin family protein